MTTVLKTSQTDLDADIREIDPAEAFERRQASALLLDVREDDERAGGMPGGAEIGRASCRERVSKQV